MFFHWRNFTLQTRFYRGGAYGSGHRWLVKCKYRTTNPKILHLGFFSLQQLIIKACFVSDGNLTNEQLWTIVWLSPRQNRSVCVHVHDSSDTICCKMPLCKRAGYKATWMLTLYLCRKIKQKKVANNINLHSRWLCWCHFHVHWIVRTAICCKMQSKNYIVPQIVPEIFQSPKCTKTMMETYLIIRNNTQTPTLFYNAQYLQFPRPCSAWFIQTLCMFPPYKEV